jgi:hypothetical protein
VKAQETKDRAEEKVRREREAKGPPFCSQIVACDQMLSWCKQYQKTEAKAAEVAKAPQDPVEFDGMVVKSKKTPEGDDDVFATARSKSVPPVSSCARCLHPVCAPLAFGMENFGCIRARLPSLSLFKAALPCNMLAPACLHALAICWQACGRVAQACGRAGMKTARRSARGSATGGEAKLTPKKIQHDMNTLALLSTLKLSVPTSTAEVEEVATVVTSLKREYEDKQKRALAGEDVPEDELYAPALQKKDKTSSAQKKGTVDVSIRCDEAFGVVLLELAAH